MYSAAHSDSSVKATRDSHREARRDDRRLTHACGRSQNSLRSCLLPPSCPAPPQSAAHRHLHSRLLTTAALLGWRRTLERPAGADRGAKQRHDKLATGVHPVGLRMMLESMWPILPPLARAFQCGARSCTQPRFSATHPTIWWQKRATGLPTICRRKPNFPPTRVAPMGRGWPPTRVAGVWEISEFSHGTRRVVCGASGGDGGERPFDRLTMLACSGLNRATKQYIYVPSIHTPCN